MKLKYLFIFLLGFTQTLANAQVKSLNVAEMGRLKALIKTDQAVASVVRQWKLLADSALVDRPNPIDTIASEGRLISDPKKQLTIKSFKDINKIYALAITYKIYGKKVYLQKATNFILAWAKLNRPIGNPINDTKLDLILEAYGLIQHEITASNNKVIKNWCMELADQEMKASSRNYNNWNSHRIKIIAAVGFMLGNDRYISYAREELKLQIEKNLEPDGSSIDFKKRDALHYHTYTLEPLLKVALMFQTFASENYFNYVSPSGSSIKKAVDFLAVYARGEKTHQEFVNSTVKIDRDRAAQKEPGFAIGANFLRVKAIVVFAFAAHFNPSYLPVYHTLATLPPLPATDQLIIDTSLYNKWLPILIQL